MKPKGTFNQVRGISCPICCSSHTEMKNGYKRGEFQLYSCRHCGVGFIKPLPSPQELQDYYNKIYPLSQNVSQFQSQEQTHEDTAMILRLIRRINPEATYVCEVGCGEGLLLASLKRRGMEVKGFELSEPLVAFARQSLGLDVEQGEIPSNLDEQFDVIIERHLLEHTLDPNEEIKRWERSLRPGGIAILGIPNFSSLASRICGAEWAWFSPPAHLYYFDGKSITYALKQNSFKVIKQFTRRGDAQNFPLALVESVYKRITKDSLPPEFGKRSNTPGSRRMVHTVATWLKPITEIMYQICLPIFLSINKLGFGEELWCVARRS